VIDVSKRTAEILGFVRMGRARVKVEYVGRARRDGRDQRLLLASYRAPGRALKGRPSDVQVAFVPQQFDPASDRARLAALAALPAALDGKAENLN
jgi:peptidoglycan lytic transglycosylase